MLLPALCQSVGVEYMYLWSRDTKDTRGTAGTTVTTVPHRNSNGHKGALQAPLLPQHLTETAMDTEDTKDTTGTTVIKDTNA